MTTPPGTFTTLADRKWNGSKRTDKRQWCPSPSESNKIRNQPAVPFVKCDNTKHVISHPFRFDLGTAATMSMHDIRDRSGRLSSARRCDSIDRWLSLFNLAYTSLAGAPLRRGRRLPSPGIMDMTKWLSRFIALKSHVFTWARTRFRY